MSDVKDARSYLDYLRIKAEQMTEVEIQGDYEEMIDVIRRELSKNWNNIEDGGNPNDPGDYLVVYVDRTDLTRELHYGVFSWLSMPNIGVPMIDFDTSALGWNTKSATIDQDSVKIIAWRKIPFYCE